MISAANSTTDHFDRWARTWKYPEAPMTIQGTKSKSSRYSLT